MNLKLLIGATIFLVGLAIELAFSTYPIFFGKNGGVALFGIKAGLVMMIIGAIILIISLCFERYKECKKFKKEIKPEDLRP